MGLFSFLKSKKPVETKVEIGKISFEDIWKWIEDKDRSLKGDEQETLDRIDGMLDEFYNSLGEKLDVLKNIDIESKKEHGRVKLLVRQGLENYIDAVCILLRDLKGIDKKDLANLVQQIGKKFILFEKSSVKFYERATYLVGDEMAAVRNEIRRFNNQLVEMFEGEGSSIKDLKRVVDVKSKLDEFEKLGGNVKGKEKEIEISDKKIGEDKKKVEKLMGEVEKIKESPEYVANLKKGEEIELLKKGLDKEVEKLKRMIDFKKLVGIVHANPRELEIVKNYRDHFSEEFSKDGKRILDLLGDSDMKSSSIDAQVSLIEKKKNDLWEKRGNVGEDPTIILLNEVKKIEDEIDGLETEKVKVKRRLEGFDLKLKGLRNEVIKLVEGFGVEVV